MCGKIKFKELFKIEELDKLKLQTLELNIELNKNLNRALT